VVNNLKFQFSSLWISYGEYRPTSTVDSSGRVKNGLKIYTKGVIRGCNYF